MASRGFQSTTIELKPYRHGYSAIVDAEQREKLVAMGPWHVTISKGHRYAVLNRSNPLRPNLRMHRVLLACPRGMEVDHINGDGLDNRLENLRVCRHADNLRNGRMRPNNTSGFRGVTVGKCGRWRAQIAINGKQIVLGEYFDKIEAAMAYDWAALRASGTFARTNFLCKGGR